MMRFLPAPIARLLRLRRELKEERVHLVQAAMKVERRAYDVRQELSRLTLEPIARG